MCDIVTASYFPVYMLSQANRHAFTFTQGTLYEWFELFILVWLWMLWALRDQEIFFPLAPELLDKTQLLLLYPPQLSLPDYLWSVRSLGLSQRSENTAHTLFSPFAVSQEMFGEMTSGLVFSQKWSLTQSELDGEEREEGGGGGRRRREGWG